MYKADAECQGLGNGCETDEDCDTGNECIREVCDAANSGLCTYELVNCNDYNTCTLDSCDPLQGCVFTPKPGCENGDCDSNADCDDDNACTAEACVQGTCFYETVPQCPTTYCTGNAQCEDGLTCTTGLCQPWGECEQEEVNCTAEESCENFFGDCVEGYGCITYANLDCSADCVVDADCVTGDACLVPSCVNGKCEVVYSQNPTPNLDGCVDDNDTTVDLCNPRYWLVRVLTEPGGYW